jgi:hypothetical protein
MIITKDGKTLTILKNSLSVDALKEYFTVGEIVLGYASNQKVLNFFTSESHGWFVETISVDSQGIELPDAKPKLHFTCPELKVFAKVMIGRGWRLT